MLIYTSSQLKCDGSESYVWRESKYAPEKKHAAKRAREMVGTCRSVVLFFTGASIDTFRHSKQPTNATNTDTNKKM